MYLFTQEHHIRRPYLSFTETFAEALQVRICVLIDHGDEIVKISIMITWFIILYYLYIIFSFI